MYFEKAFKDILIYRSYLNTTSRQFCTQNAQNFLMRNVEQCERINESEEWKKVLLILLLYTRLRRNMNIFFNLVIIEQ